jgi:hypothetical protein
VSENAPKPKPKKKPRSRGWRIFFACFKWTRVVILLALLGFVILGLFLNRVGLPDWVHRRIVAQMREKGWDMQFSRLRLRWYRGIVADQLQLSRTNTMTGPNLFVETAEFRLNGRALRSFNLQSDSVFVSGARLVWPLPGTNQPKQTFVLNNVRGELLFKPGDQWELRSLSAQGLGAQVHIRGDITNASYLRDWKLPQRKEPREPKGPRHDFWHDFLTQADKVRFATPPEISVIFGFDARDARSLDALVKLTAPSVVSPWGTGTNFNLAVRTLPAASSNDLLLAEVKLSANHPRTPWGAASNIQLTARLEPSFTQVFPTNGTLRLDALAASTPWGDAERFALEARTAPALANDAARVTRFNIHSDGLQTEHGHVRALTLEAESTHPSTNLFPAVMRAEATLSGTRATWATSEWTRVEASLELPRREEWLLSHTNLAWPERLANVPFDLTATFSNALGARLEFAHGTLTNRWHPPELRFDIDAGCTAGALALHTTLDTLTRAARGDVKWRGDPHALAPFLSTNALPWLADYQSAEPLELQAAGGTTLPAWTNWSSDWATNLLPTLTIAGRVTAGEGSFRKAPFTAVSALCLYTNGVATLPQIHITRPEGSIDADAELNPRTADFRAKFHSTINPLVLSNAIPGRIPRFLFAWFRFTAPPEFRVEALGNWRDFSKLGLLMEASGTNFTFRDQSARFASVRGIYTNQFISLYRPFILRDGESGGADGIGFDASIERLYLTNAAGNLNPTAVTTAIGKHAVRALKPYTFDVPPRVVANGSIPTRDHNDEDVDLRFELEGGPFHWWHIHADPVRASIHWLGDTLTITNITAGWAGAPARGWIWFDFAQTNGGAMAFHVTTTNCDLSRLVRELQDGKTNKLEGDLALDLVIDRAAVDDLKSWHGYGETRLKDGLIWDIPLFGLASRIMNEIVPGLGRSHARQGTATFTITNSVIYTKDLEVQASGMHLKYHGTVDFDGVVEARMEAKILRGIPGLGPLISAVLTPVGKLFEYRVSGTLEKPKLQDVYLVPRIITLPLQPFKWMKNIFRDDEKGEKTDPDPPAERKPATSPKTAP